jgi:hypothetical protein
MMLANTAHIARKDQAQIRERRRQQWLARVAEELEKVYTWKAHHAADDRVGIEERHFGGFQPRPCCQESAVSGN